MKASLDDLVCSMRGFVVLPIPAASLVAKFGRRDVHLTFERANRHKISQQEWVSQYLSLPIRPFTFSPLISQNAFKAEYSKLFSVPIHMSVNRWRSSLCHLGSLLCLLFRVSLFPGPLYSRRSSNKFLLRHTIVDTVKNFPHS
jgi:hypothetical protein